MKDPLLSENSKALFELATRYAFAGCWHEAALCWTEYFAAGDGDAHAYRHMGVALERLGHREQALDALQEAVARAPQDAVCLTALGDLLARGGDTGGAVGAWQAALSVAPENVNTLYNLGVAYERLGDSERAAKCFREAVERYEMCENPIVLIGLGARFEDAGDLDAAIRALARAWLLDQTDEHLRYMLSRCYAARASQFPETDAEAISLLERAVGLEPESPVLRLRLGVRFWATGDLEAAKHELGTTARLRGVSAADAAQPHHCRVSEDELACYQYAVQAAPDDPDAYRLYGIALLKSGDIDLAVSRLLEALRLKPDDHAARLHLGTALQARGLAQSARSQWETVASLAESPLGEEAARLLAKSSA